LSKEIVVKRNKIKRRESEKKLHSCTEVLSSLRPLVSDEGYTFTTTEE